MLLLLLLLLLLLVSGTHCPLPVALLDCCFKVVGLEQGNGLKGQMSCKTLSRTSVLTDFRLVRIDLGFKPFRWAMGYKAEVWALTQRFKP